MSDERSDFAVGGTEGDSSVDTGGEGSDTVLEEMTDDLHDGRLVLNDGNVWRLVEFAVVSPIPQRDESLTKRRPRNNPLAHACQSQ